MPSFSSIVLEYPPGLWLILPGFLVLGLSIWLQYRNGSARPRLLALGTTRLLVLITLVILVARPVRITRAGASPNHRKVTLLLDTSESMGLEDERRTRFDKALDFARERLVSELGAAGLSVQTMRFDEQSAVVDLGSLGGMKPTGRRTNLGGAVALAMASSEPPPLAVIALTDGSVNETVDNNRALADLLDSRTPFIGVGFGSDLGVRSLSLRNVDAPPAVALRSSFRIDAQLEVLHADGMPDFDLLLFRNGALHQRRKVSPGRGSRTWLERFQVTEEAEGVHAYKLQLIVPGLEGVKCFNHTATCSVRVSDQKELRVLYIQGALTWDYKFVRLALRDDPTIKVTGLTRTSKESVFRQNVESSGELLSGFPTSLQELGPFRVVVLSNIRPADLTAAQQQVLASFCSELGGGLLMIGGADTFGPSWKASRLEQLMPVRFADDLSAMQRQDRAFHLRLSEDALQHPVFQLGDYNSSREAWRQLPAFLQYAPVDAAKPGAQIWARHESDQGPGGPRILMASQRYGAGLSAVISIQNFWRWRMARDSDPRHFDRFWRQLFRFLSDAGRQEISLQLADPDLRPGMDVRVSLDRQPGAGQLSERRTTYLARVEGPDQKLVLEQAVDLEILRPANITFHAGPAGTYTVTVLDRAKAVVASRSFEIRDLNVELQATARNMETLRQWAAFSGGIAVKAEECPDASVLVRQIKSRLDQVLRERQLRRPAGLNAWTFVLLLGCLGSEWLLRRHWAMR